MEQLADRIRYKTRWIINRYPSEAHYLRGIPAPVPDLNLGAGATLPAESIIDGNVLLTAGITALWNILTGVAANNKFDANNAAIGVGDNSTTAANNQTGLLAPANHAYNTMSANFPTVSATTATWQAAFNANQANFNWQEYVLNNAGNNASNTVGQNLNRVASNQGTKSSGQVWTVQIQISLS